MSLRARFRIPDPQPRHAIVLFAVVTGIVLIALVAYDLRREYLAEVREAGAKTRNLAVVLEEHARQSLRRVELSMERAGDEIRDAGELSRIDLAALGQRLRTHLPQDGLISSIAVIGRTGTVELSTRAADARTLPPVADRDYFLAHRDRAGVGTMIGALINNRVDGKRVMPVSRRLDAPGGAFNGVLLAVVDPAYFQRFYDSVDTGANGFVTLFERSGWIVVRAPFSAEILSRNWADSPMFREHLPASEVKTVRQVVVADGVERIYSYRALKDYPVIVTTGLSLTDILADWRAHAWRDAVVLAMVLAVLAGATLTLVRQLRRREAAETDMRRLSSIVDSTSDTVATARVDGRLVYVNAAGRRSVGIGADEAIGRFRTQQFYPPERWEFMQQVARPAAVKDGVWSGENRLRALDGHELEVLQVLIVHRDASGNPEFFTGISRDITERKRAEQQLQEQAELLRVAESMAHMISLEWDIRTDRFNWSRSPEWLLGPRPPSGSYPLFKDLVHPEDRQRFLATRNAALDNSPEHRLDYRIVRTDGEVRWISSRGRVIRDAGGRAARMHVALRDVTEHKQIELELAALAAGLEATVASRTESLARSEARLHHLIDFSPAVIYAAKTSGDYGATFVSSNIRDQLGHAPEDFLGDSGFWASHIHPQDRERVLARQQLLFTDGRIRAEYRFRHQDGSWRWMDDVAVLVRDAAGEPQELVGAWFDVTERHLARRAIEEALRAKLEFMNNVTHELRTPLNAVIGFAGLLKDEVPGPLNAKQHQFVADILAGGERLHALAEGILEMSRLDAPGAELEREPVDIGAALEERVAAQRKAAAARGIAIQLEVAPETGSAELDPQALRRMLDALIDNAIKFNRDDGTLAVRAQRNGGWLEIAVADTGIGIAPEDLPKLFKPLVQLDAGLARRHGGIGLGLALARRLAELHGGTLEVASEPGKGSTFTLRLPTTKDGVRS